MSKSGMAWLVENSWVSWHAIQWGQCALEGAVVHSAPVPLQTAIPGFASVLIAGCIASIFTSVFPIVRDWDGGSSCRCPQLSLEDKTDVSLFPSLYVIWISASEWRGAQVLTQVLPTWRLGASCVHDGTEYSLHSQSYTHITMVIF